MVSVCGDPTEEQWGDLLFAWRACKHVGSNAIVLAKDLQTVGIGAGQQSRVDAVRLARREGARARARPRRRRARLGRVLPVRRRPAARARGRRHVDHPARRLEARRRGRRSGRGGGRGDGLHRPPPLPALSPATARRLGFARRGPRVPHRPRPRRRHADRPPRPDLAGRPRDDPREARVPEPGRLGQGSNRAGDDRGGRARGEAEAGRDDRRAHLGQHGRRPRDRRGAEGLPLHLRDARQDEPGEDLDAARVRRRGRDHADRGRRRLAGVVLLRLVAPRRGDSRRLQARPVLEHVEPRSALHDDRAGDLGADRRRRHRRARHLGGHRGNDLRDRPLLQGAQAGGADRRRRPGRLRLHREGRGRPAPVPRRGDRQGHVAEDDGPRRRRRVGARLGPRLVPRCEAAGARGGAARRRLRRARRSGPRSRSRSGSGPTRRS